MTEDNDWVEQLLRADRAIPVRDEGFTARLLAQIPSRQRWRTWITPLMTGIGALLAFLTLGGLSPAMSAFRQIEAGDLAAMSASGQVVLLALLVLPLAVVLVGGAWALSEAR